MKLTVLALVCLCGSISSLRALSISVPNASFEAPVVPSTVPALPFFEAWQHTPRPEWYVEDPNAPETQWVNLAGVFPNPAVGQAGRIENTDMAQAGYIFGVPSNGVFQELDATYEIAQGYQLTVALAPSLTIPPTQGSTLGISLYYRDSSNQIVTITTTNVPYNSANFPSLTNLMDFSVSTQRPTRASDPWLGKKIGIMLVSTAAPEKAGGIWDIDNVRLSSFSVLNGSFEAPEVPTTVPALPFFVEWQHGPKPDWYVEDPNAPETAWANLAGVFPNPPAGSAGNIANIDGKQAAYLFAVPSNGIFQETTAIYEPGVSYQLSLGIVGSSTFPPPEGTTLSISLYYRSSPTNLVPLASRDVVYNATNFHSLSNLVSVSVATQPLTNNHPALGKNIGVAITSTVATAGGVWDLDDVRLSGTLLRLAVSLVQNSLRVTWATRANTAYQLQTSQNLTNWTDSGSPVAGSGSDATVEIASNAQVSRTFFRVRLAQ